MDKEFQRYYYKPSDKILDEKFEEKIEFCFDVYDHIFADLNQDLPEVGLDFLGEIWNKILTSIKKKLLFVSKTFMIYMTKNRIKEEFDVDNFIKQMRIRQKKDPTVQKGLIDDEFIQFLTSKDDESVKAQKIKRFFDPLVLEFQESILSIDDVLKNKYQFISMQPTKVQDHLQVVLLDIQNKMKSDNIDFSTFTAHEREVLFYLKYFQSGSMVKQITDEIQVQIGKQTNDKFKKVIRQILSGDQKAKEEFIVEKESQTEQTGKDIELLQIFQQKQIYKMEEKIRNQEDIIKRITDQQAYQQKLFEEQKLELEKSIQNLKEDYMQIIYFLLTNSMSQKEMNKFKKDANRFASQIVYIKNQQPQPPLIHDADSLTQENSISTDQKQIKKVNQNNESGNAFNSDKLNADDYKLDVREYGVQCLLLNDKFSNLNEDANQEYQIQQQEYIQQQQQFQQDGQQKNKQYKQKQQQQDKNQYKNEQKIENKYQPNQSNQPSIRQKTQEDKMKSEKNDLSQNFIQKEKSITNNQKLINNQKQKNNKKNKGSENLINSDTQEYSNLLIDDQNDQQNIYNHKEQNHQIYKQYQQEYQDSTKIENKNIYNQKYEQSFENDEQINSTREKSQSKIEQQSNTQYKNKSFSKNYRHSIQNDQSVYNQQIQQNNKIIKNNKSLHQSLIDNSNTKQQLNQSQNQQYINRNDIYDTKQALKNQQNYSKRIETSNDELQENNEGIEENIDEYSEDYNEEDKNNQDINQLYPKLKNQQLKNNNSQNSLNIKSRKDINIQKSPRQAKLLDFQTPLTKQKLINQQVDELLHHEELERQIELQMTRQIQSSLLENNMVNYLDASKQQISNSIKKQSAVYKSQQDIKLQKIQQTLQSLQNDQKNKKIYVQFPMVQNEEFEQEEEDQIQDLYKYMKKEGNQLNNFLYLAKPEFFNDSDLSKMGIDKIQGEFSPEKKLKNLSPINKMKYPFKSIDDFGTQLKNIIPDPKELSQQFRLSEEEKQEIYSFDNISFLQFKEMYKMILQVHKQCPNCNHLKQFYLKIGFDEQSYKSQAKQMKYKSIRSQSQNQNINKKLPQVNINKNN